MIEPSKTKPEAVYQILVDENQDMDNADTYVKQISIEIKHFIRKSNIFKNV